MLQETGINREAIFSDGTKYYICPQEPKEKDLVKIRCRVARDNVDSVVFVCQEFELPMQRMQIDCLLYTSRCV